MMIDARNKTLEQAIEKIKEIAPDLDDDSFQHSPSYYCLGQDIIEMLKSMKIDWDGALF